MGTDQNETAKPWGGGRVITLCGMLPQLWHRCVSVLNHIKTFKILPDSDGLVS